MEKEDITGKVIKAAYEVHNNLKSGFQEVVYQRALAREMRALGLEFKREEKIPVYYKGSKIDTRRVDFNGILRLEFLFQTGQNRTE